MGNNQNKVSPLSIPLLIKQLNSYHLPEDRNGALETIEQIDIHLIDQSTFEAKSKQFKDCEGLYFIIKVVKKMVEGKRVYFMFFFFRSFSISLNTLFSFILSRY